MCGIAGVIQYNRTKIDPAILLGLDAALAHRGPDGRGFLSYRSPTQIQVAKDPCALSLGYVGLVHRRLAIFDVSAAGWQPMGTPDGRAYIIFNGAIYNYRELRDELASCGYRFHSQSDTEVLLQAYLHFGPQVLTRLVGMFAFAILDVQTQSLFLARDAFGIKPLYYTVWRDGFAFASEIKPLLGLPGVRRVVQPQRLYSYLRFGVTDDGDETLFAGIQQLPAAHYLHLSLCPANDVEPTPTPSVERLLTRHDVSPLALYRAEVQRGDPPRHITIQHVFNPRAQGIEPGLFRSSKTNFIAAVENRVRHQPTHRSTKNIFARPVCRNEIRLG